MRVSKRLSEKYKRSFVSLLVVFSMLLSVLSAGLAKPVDAKTSRAAIIMEIQGTVSIKKSGGSKSFIAYKDMSLSQGDQISTGADSSAVVRIPDHEDEITIGDNAEVNVADLSTKGDGKTSKFKSWAGSVWVKVKSLVSSEDEFEVETPTAVMGVRGTQYYVAVDPDTGGLTVFVGTGIVQTDKTSGESNSVLLYPAQQISLQTGDPVTDLKARVGLVDIEKLVQTASPQLIEAIIKNKAEMDKENKAILDKQQQDLEQGLQVHTLDNTTLQIKDLEDLNKIAQNLNNVIGNIAKVALAMNKITPEKMNQIIEAVNQGIKDPTKKIDLNNVPPLDPTAGVDPALEAEKQAVINKLKQQLAEKALADQQAKEKLLVQYKTLLAAVEEHNQEIAAANKKAAAEQQQQIEKQYVSQLPDAAQKDFEKNKQQNQPSNNPGTTSSTPSANPSSGSTGGGAGGGRSSSNKSRQVPAPALVSPTTPVEVKQGPVQLKLSAEVGSTIEIINGIDVIATAPGKGSEAAEFNIGGLANGEYDFTARAARGGGYSTTVAVPKITVNYPPTVKLPDIVLAQDGKTGNIVNLLLTMKDFTDEKQFYALEAHLVYDKSALSYNGPKELDDIPGTVFDGVDKSAETLNQMTGTQQYELIYAASQYVATGSTTAVENLTIAGEKPLVRIPLTVAATTSDSVKVELVYVKVVNKNGDTVAEFKSSKSISLTTK